MNKLVYYFCYFAAIICVFGAEGSFLVDLPLCMYGFAMLGIAALAAARSAKRMKNK